MSCGHPNVDTQISHEGNHVFSVFLDFRKAFDCVDNNILLSKLHCYGIRGVAHKWFKSYLTNRKQYVVIGNTQSELLDINHGVPQGSVLGPLLFLIFINDIVKSTSFFKFILFADDSTLSTSLPNDNHTVITRINNELQTVSKWLRADKICINVDKKNILYSPVSGQLLFRTLKLAMTRLKKLTHQNFSASLSIKI